MQLLEWWNLVFVLPFIGALFYLLLQASGLVSGGGSEMDSDLDHDLDVGTDIDPGVDVDHDIDAGDHHLFDHGGSDVSGMAKALSFLGIGKVPLSLIIMTFCFIWGFTGWASNLLLEPVLRTPLVFFWVSVGVAMFISLSLTGLTVKGLSKVMPNYESYGISGGDLLGRVGKAVYPITSRGGSARLHDNYGNLQEVPCRVEEGESEIPSGSNVLLLRYDGRKKVYWVKPDPLKDSGISLE